MDGNNPVLRKAIIHLWHDGPIGGRSVMDNTQRRLATLFCWKGLEDDVVT